MLQLSETLTACEGEQELLLASGTLTLPVLALTKWPSISRYPRPKRRAGQYDCIVLRQLLRPAADMWSSCLKVFKGVSTISNIHLQRLERSAMKHTKNDRTRNSLKELSAQEIGEIQATNSLYQPRGNNVHYVGVHPFFSRRGGVWKVPQIASDGLRSIRLARFTVEV